MSTLTQDVAGVNADLTWGSLSNTQITDQVNKMVAAGVRHCRLNLSWNMLEPTAKGTYNATNLAVYDHAINSLVNAGIKILATFGHSVPYWASADPNKTGGTSWNQKWRPTNMSDYADNCTYMMKRWGAKFEIVQIWNEPNNAGFWPSQTTEQARVTEYVQMLTAGCNAVKAVDPNKPVASGGMSNGNNYPALHYLYQAGGKPYFNLAAWHPYTDNVDPAMEFTETNRITGSGQVKAKDAFYGLDTCRQIMIDNGDEAKGVVLTEWGYTTTTTTGGVTEANQAAFLGRGWDRLIARPWIRRAYWYIFRETEFTSPPDPYGFDWLNEFGLVTNVLVDKPARNTFATRAASSTSSTGTTGILTGAASPILVTGRTNGKTYRARIQAFGPGGDGPWLPYSANVIIGQAPIFSVHPANATVADGTAVSFTATSAGSAPISYAWEQMLTDGTVATVTQATAATLSFTATASLSGRQFRRVDTNFKATTRSNWALLTVNAVSQYGPQPFNGPGLPTEFAVLGSSGGGNASIVNGRMRVDAATAGYAGSVLLGLTRGGTVPNFGGNFEMTTKILRDAFVGEEMYTGFHARRRNADSTRFTFEWVGDMEVYVVNASGVSTEIGRFVFGYPSTDYWLKIRVKDEVLNGVAGTSVQMKFWPVGGTEPAYGTPLRTTAVPATGADYDLTIYQASGNLDSGWAEYDDLLITGA